MDLADHVTSSLNDKRYESLLLNQIISTFQQRACLYRIIFMQDLVPSHIAKPVMQILKGHFGKDPLTIRHCPKAPPLRSPNLNPCDFWMWRYLENVEYICLIANLAELKVWIHTFTMSPQRHSGLLLKMLFIGFNMWTMMDRTWNLSAACLAIVKNRIIMCFLCDFWPKPNHYVLFIWFLFQEQLKT